MKVHLFAAVSSPGCANFGLKREADEGESEFGKTAANFVYLVFGKTAANNFYVDDGLISVSSVKEAIDLLRNSRDLCARTGLKLHKFVSNKLEVLKCLPESDRATSFKSFDIHTDSLHLERALGVFWCIQNNTFQFRIESKDNILTKRAILATVSSIFDPIGFVATFLLESKKILQELFWSGSSWDDPIFNNLSSRWRKWRLEVKNLETLKIQHCVKPGNFGEVKITELNHFSDASEKGYCQCYCSFVSGKARVKSLKQVTIPRLELTAAVMSAEINKFLKVELKLADVKEYFWVDSKIVFGYINNKDFRTFLTEVECIINLRPLSIENVCDPTYLEPSTPNHLLTMKPKLLLPPPGRFLETDQYARKRWRRVQLLSDQFWRRWRKEYLHLLQSRTKWSPGEGTRNMKGDVVIISDSVSEPRSQWRLGRIKSRM